MARRRAEKDQLGRKEFFRLMEKMIGAGSPERDAGLMEGVMVCAAKSFIAGLGDHTGRPLEQFRLDLMRAMQSLHLKRHDVTDRVRGQLDALLHLSDVVGQILPSRSCARCSTWLSTYYLVDVASRKASLGWFEDDRRAPFNVCGRCKAVLLKHKSHVVISTGTF